MTSGPTGFAYKLSPSSYPLVDVFGESFSLSLSFLPVVADGKGCEAGKSLTQIHTDHIEVMPQPTPADAVNKLHWNWRSVLKKHFC